MGKIKRCFYLYIAIVSGIAVAHDVDKPKKSHSVHKARKAQNCPCVSTKCCCSCDNRCDTSIYSPEALQYCAGCEYTQSHKSRKKRKKKAKASVQAQVMPGQMVQGTMMQPPMMQPQMQQQPMQQAMTAPPPPPMMQPQMQQPQMQQPQMQQPQMQQPQMQQPPMM